LKKKAGYSSYTETRKTKVEVRKVDILADIRGRGGREVGGSQLLRQENSIKKRRFF
jgi:hypothetical protein